MCPGFESRSDCSFFSPCWFYFFHVILIIYADYLCQVISKSFQLNKSYWADMKVLRTDWQMEAIPIIPSPLCGRGLINLYSCRSNAPDRDFHLTPKCDLSCGCKYCARHTMQIWYRFIPNNFVILQRMSKIQPWQIWKHIHRCNRMHIVLHWTAKKGD